MKRFVLNVVEEKLHDHILAEYIAARQGRDRAQKALKRVKRGDFTGWKREFERVLAMENLAVNRESIRILTDLNIILRRY